MSEKQPDRGTVSMVVSIVDKGKSEKVLQVCQRHSVFHHISLAHGTARTELLSLLGLGETPKEMVFCLTPGEQVGCQLTLLAEKLGMRYPGKGVAFAVPLNGIGSRAYNALSMETKEGSPMEEKKQELSFDGQHDLVIAVVNQGYTDLIMDAARKAGAKGGTVIHARGVLNEEAAQFLGISVHAEREMLFLVVQSDIKQAVMQAINKEAGLKTMGNGIVFSMPVSQAIGLAEPF